MSEVSTELTFSLASPHPPHHFQSAAAGTVAAGAVAAAVTLSQYGADAT